MEGLRSLTVMAVALALGLSAIVAPARAALVGTEQLLAQPEDARARVDAFLARDEVRHRLEAWGVAPAEAQQRVAALSEAEVARLAQRIDAVPAGGGVLEVVGIVFVVLLILELVGVTNIFTAI